MNVGTLKRLLENYDDEWEMTVKAYDMEKVSRGFDSFWVCVEIEV